MLTPLKDLTADVRWPVTRRTSRDDLADQTWGAALSVFSTRRQAFVEVAVEFETLRALIDKLATAGECDTVI